MKKLILSLIAVGILSSQAFSEQITWDDAVKQALANNPSIQSAKLRLDNAQRSYNIAVGAFFPDISLKGSAGRSGNDTSTSNSFSYGANASLSLFSGFETYNNVSQKSADLNAAQADYNRTISDVSYELATQYVNLMWAYQTVTLSKQIQARRIQNKEMINLKYNSGSVDIGSLRRVEADVETAAFDVRKAQRYVDTASAALSRALGRTGGEILEPVEKMDIPDADRSYPKPVFDTLVQKIPEYISAYYGAQSAGYAYAKAKSAWWPDISASAGVSRSGREWAPSDNSWNIGLSISYPIFNGGQRLQNVNIAANQRDIVEQTFKDTVNLLKSQAIANFNSLTDAFENLTVRELYLEASRQQAEISQQKYINGLSSYRDWYSIENDYINSQTSLLDSKRSAIMARFKWQNFIGNGFDYMHP